MNAKQCGICGSAKLTFAFAESNNGTNFEQYSCASCGVMQTIGDVAAVSPDYVRLTAEDLTEEHRAIQTKSKLQAFAQWRDLMRRYGKQSGAVVDIGCGVGGFLDYAKKAGFQAMGFDASSAQAHVAREQHDLVRNAISFADYKEMLGGALPPVQMVTMWDVFEHIRDPQALLADVRSVMEPDGLFYVSVPGGGLNQLKVNFRKILGKTPGLVPWEHVYYHVPRSLKKVLVDNGFEVLEIGGTAPYQRGPEFAERFRQVVQKVIAPTSRALQIYAVARPAK